MKCFLAFLKKELRASGTYKFEFWIRLVYGLIAMYGARCLWVALDAQNPQIVGRDLPSMITYAMLAMALDMVFYPSGSNAPHRYIMDQVKKGAIDTDLLRPMDLRGQVLLRNAGTVLYGAATLVLPACVLAMLFWGMRPPASWMYGGLFLASVAMGYWVLFSLNFLLGLLSIVTLNNRQITWAYNGMVALLSGKLVPIWLFPAGLRAVANALPFRCIFEIPLNVYTGALAGRDLAAGLLLQACWALALALIGRLAWSAAHRRLVVQGG
ncbi:MAG TPA: ABC-2 family transporter protein [Clostridia bacterium]|nr:ABC-2 family transporter protein [Clostridia bacterium]